MHDDKSVKLNIKSTAHQSAHNSHNRSIAINHLRISTNLKRDLDLAHFISIYIVDVSMVVVVAVVVAVVSVMLLTLDNI